VSNPHGSPTYLPHYLTFMTVICVLPYLEENIRCLRRKLPHRRTSPS
jgi:hypothetical protein